MKAIGPLVRNAQTQVDFSVGERNHGPKVGNRPDEYHRFSGRALAARFQAGLFDVHNPKFSPAIALVLGIGTDHIVCTIIN